MIEFETELEFDDAVEGIAIENSHLGWRRCECGASALADQAWRGAAQCGECRRRAAGAGHGWANLAGRYTAVHGFELKRQAPAEAVREAYPAPEVTSRDPWDGTGAPSALLKQAERAVAASWRVRVQRSRGRAPHAAHGSPGVLKWRYALILGNGEWSAYAVHDESSWVSVMLWGRSRPWFSLASIGDLADYVDARGEMGDRWYAAIAERERDRIARGKERAACNRGTHPRAIAQNGVMRCPACENVWAVGAQSWRKPKKGREGAS